MRLRTITWILLQAMAIAASADDWPQWMGPERTGVWRETGIIEKFPTSGPKVLWRTPISGGYSGPAAADGKVFVTDFVHSSDRTKNDPSAPPGIAGMERVLCLNAANGKVIWKHEYDCHYKIAYPSGPRTTPTVAGGKVYTLGAEGNLFCLDAVTGKSLWSKELKREYKLNVPGWGFCGHPLVDGKRLFCLVGGEGSVAVAFDMDTGQELWRALSAATYDVGYCPPMLIEAGGKRQLLIWKPQALNSLDPETGQVYWTEKLGEQNGWTSAPQKAGDYLYASGYGNCAALFKLSRDKPAAEVVWDGKPNTAVYCFMSTPVIDGDTIYGVDSDDGCLRAVKLATGERLWETSKPISGDRRRRQYGTAFITKNDDRYFLFSEMGDLIIARLSPEKYEEVSQAHIVEPTSESNNGPVVYSHPAYANKCAFIRNDEEIVCVSLAK